MRSYESGVRTSHIARKVGPSDSTVRAIIRRKDRLKRIENINEAFGPSTSYSQFQTRSSAIEMMERLLISWIENCNHF